MCFCWNEALLAELHIFCRHLCSSSRSLTVVVIQQTKSIMMWLMMIWYKNYGGCKGSFQATKLQNSCISSEWNLKTWRNSVISCGRTTKTDLKSPKFRQIVLHLVVLLFSVTKMCSSQWSLILPTPCTLSWKHECKIYWHPNHKVSMWLTNSLITRVQTGVMQTPRIP